MTESEVLPPPFEQVTVYVYSPGATPDIICAPMRSRAPLQEPLAVQLAAMVLVHESRKLAGALNVTGPFVPLTRRSTVGDDPPR
jgi:hypothetical protein